MMNECQRLEHKNLLLQLMQKVFNSQTIPFHPQAADYSFAPAA
jgi:hypothetical protein